MKKYETVIKVMQKAFNKTEAEEKAGVLFGSSKMETNTVLSHEKTQLLSVCIQNNCVIKKYETTVRVLNEACDELEAGEKAGYLVDIERMLPDTTISCDPTKMAAEKESPCKNYKSIAG
ncbi:MAG: hypothetical protein ISS92_02615 [Candidatus Omnitrophica bacterium]|nr:hypothetical protein [Candidatus Omnitrophota bacterium]